RDIAFVHRGATIEMRAIRHSRSVEMGAWRPRIFAHIDVGSHHIAVVIDVIAELAWNVVPVFRNHLVMTRRSGEPGFPGRDGRFADYTFAFVKVRFLFADTNDDFR